MSSFCSLIIILIIIIFIFILVWMLQLDIVWLKYWFWNILEWRSRWFLNWIIITIEKFSKLDEWEIILFCSWCICIPFVTMRSSSSPNESNRIGPNGSIMDEWLLKNNKSIHYESRWRYSLYRFNQWLFPFGMGKKFSP